MQWKVADIIRIAANKINIEIGKPLSLSLKTKLHTVGYSIPLSVS